MQELMPYIGLAVGSVIGAWGVRILARRSPWFVARWWWLLILFFAGSIIVTLVVLPSSGEVGSPERARVLSVVMAMIASTIAAPLSMSLLRERRALAERMAENPEEEALEHSRTVFLAWCTIPAVVAAVLRPIASDYAMLLLLAAPLGFVTKTLRTRKANVDDFRTARASLLLSVPGVVGSYVAALWYLEAPEVLQFSVPIILAFIGIMLAIAAAPFIGLYQWWKSRR